MGVTHDVEVTDDVVVTDVMHVTDITDDVEVTDDVVVMMLCMLRTLRMMLGVTDAGMSKILQVGVCTAPTRCLRQL